MSVIKSLLSKERLITIGSRRFKPVPERARFELDAHNMHTNGHAYQPASSNEHSGCVPAQLDAQRHHHHIMFVL